jgi:hypothetical protein
MSKGSGARFFTFSLCIHVFGNPIVIVPACYEKDGTIDLSLEHLVII